MHRTDKRAEIAALIGLGLQVLFFGLLLVMFQVNRSPATLAESWHFLAGGAIWIAIFIQLYQQRMAHQQRNELEDLERQRLGRVGGSESVFRAIDPNEELPAERRLKFIKRWIVPIFSIFTSGILILLASLLFPSWRPMVWIKDAMEATVRNQYATLTIAAIVSLACFVLSRYCLGLSRGSGWRTLRAGSNYIVGNSLACFALAIVLAFSAYGVPTPERMLAQAIPILMALLAVEILLNLILDVYRPRIPGQEQRPCYESRLLGLFSEPEGVLHSIAQTIDYQFGFKVSETWFYKLLQETVVWLLLFGALTLYLPSIFVIVHPGQQAVITHFGQKPAAPLGEGFHWKMPWPIDTATVYDVQKVRQMIIGITGESWMDAKEKKPILWTVKHTSDTGKEFQLLVASDGTRGDREGKDDFTAAPATQPATQGDTQELSPVNILAGELVLYYRIKDQGLLDYVAGYENPEKVLETLAYRQWTQYMANVDLMGVMTTDRGRATETLQKNIQSELDARQSGLELVRIAMVGMHPPIEIAPSFESAINARQERETMVYRARGDANQRLPAARAFERETKCQAEGQRYGKLVLEQARAEKFSHQLESYRFAPDVFKLRNQLDVFLQATDQTRKYILAVAHPEKLLLIVDDKEKVPEGVLGLGSEISKEVSNSNKQP